MSSQFFGLNIAYSGLVASNAGLNTTMNNVSNVETEGYSRQVVVQEASEALRTFTTYGCAGAGVDVLAVERMRDEFYDVKYWNNNADVGEYDVKSYYMKQIEDYLRDDETLEGFGTIFDAMYDALGQLQTDAGDATKKTQFVGTASSLAEYFESQYSNLEKLQEDVNAEILIKVDEINTLAASIAALNKQINVLEVGGSTANELRDQRTLLIDQLSAIVDVEVVEQDVIDPNNPDRLTGATYYTVTIAGGQTLVDTNEYNQIVCVARESYEKVNQTDADGLYDLYWTTPGSEFNKDTATTFNIYASNLGGELKALIQMRDGNNGENFNGTVTGIGTTDDGTKQTVTIEATADYLTDINKLNLSDQGGEINIGNEYFYYDSWSVTFTDDGKAVYEFELSADLNDARIEINKVGKTAEIGSDIEYKGIPYYMSQMNEWVRSYASAFNNILTDGGVDSYGNAAEALFVADDLVNGGQISLVDGLTTISMTDYSYYYLTAKNFTVSDAIVADGELLATKTESSDEGSSGVAKSDIIDALINLKSDKEAMSFRGASASEFLQTILADVTLEASTANLFYDNYSNIAATIDTQRQSIFGVDSDEEALNLVKYQNAYTLASKMIQVLTEVYDQLILNTGV